MALDAGLSLFAYTFSGNFVGEFTAAVSDLEMERAEGPLRLSWSFAGGDGGVDESAMRSWFYNRLMYEIKVFYEGEQVWSGYVWEMELEIGKLILKRGMTEMANAISATHSEDNNLSYVSFQYAAAVLPDGTQADTNDNAWVLVNESIRQYGRHEVILDSNGSDGEALELCLTAIETLPDPFNSEVVYRPQDTAQLRITAVGRSTIANKFYLMNGRLRYHPDYEDLNWEDLYIEDGDDWVEWTVGNEVERIVDTIEYNTGWLYKIKIAENDTPTKVGVSSTTGAFDRLVELLKLRNSDGEHYQLTILDDGGVIYDKYNTTPMYMLQTAELGVMFFDGTVPKWQARPGIIKAIAGLAGPVLPTSWLSDDTLIPTERTTMRDGDEFASFHSRKVDVIEMQSALYAHLRSLEETQQEEENGGSTTLQ